MQNFRTYTQGLFIREFDSLNIFIREAKKRFSGVHKRSISYEYPVDFVSLMNIWTYIREVGTHKRDRLCTQYIHKRSFYYVYPFLLCISDIHSRNISYVYHISTMYIRYLMYVSLAKRSVCTIDSYEYFIIYRGGRAI